MAGGERPCAEDGAKPIWVTDLFGDFRSSELAPRLSASPGQRHAPARQIPIGAQAGRPRRSAPAELDRDMPPSFASADRWSIRRAHPGTHRPQRAGEGRSTHPRPAGRSALAGLCDGGAAQAFHQHHVEQDAAAPSPRTAEPAGATIQPRRRASTIRDQSRVAVARPPGRDHPRAAAAGHRRSRSPDQACERRPAHHSKSGSPSRIRRLAGKACSWPEGRGCSARQSAPGGTRAAVKHAGDARRGLKSRRIHERVESLAAVDKQRPFSRCRTMQKACCFQDVGNDAPVASFR